MKWYILSLLTLMTVLGTVFLTACATLPPTQETPPSPPPITEGKPPEEVKPEPEEIPRFPLTIVDDLDRTVKIERLPQRIVSLAPSSTEILFALGLEDKLVGTTDYCDYPAAAKAKPRVAGYLTPDMEKVVSLEPDLVLAESIHKEMVLPALEKLGLTVVVMSAETIDTVIKDIALIGQINGKSRAASQLINNLTSRIETITTKTKDLSAAQRPRVLYVCWHDPIWTMGRKTFINDLIWKAGGINIFANDFEKSRVVSLEAVVAKNPQVIIVSGMGTSGNLIYISIIKETRLAGIDAVANKMVYKISDANLIERPGPRIVDGLEEVAKFIHPEIFGAASEK